MKDDKNDVRNGFEKEFDKAFGIPLGVNFDGTKRVVKKAAFGIGCWSAVSVACAVVAASGILYVICHFIAKFW